MKAPMERIDTSMPTTHLISVSSYTNSQLFVTIFHCATAYSISNNPWSVRKLGNREDEGYTFSDEISVTNVFSARFMNARSTDPLNVVVWYINWSAGRLSTLPAGSEALVAGHVASLLRRSYAVIVWLGPLPHLSDIPSPPPLLNFPRLIHRAVGSLANT